MKLDEIAAAIIAADILELDSAAPLNQTESPMQISGPTVQDVQAALKRAAKAYPDDPALQRKILQQVGNAFNFEQLRPDMFAAVIAAAAAAVDGADWRKPRDVTGASLNRMADKIYDAKRKGE